MKLEQIEQAIMVAKTKSISLAAESLFISQPNLSLSIKKLEEEIGYPIFERTNKGVEVTPLGQNFIDLAKLIMLQIRQLQNIGNYAARKSQQLLSIAHMHYRYVNHAAAELFHYLCFACVHGFKICLCAGYVNAHFNGFADFAVQIGAVH